MFDEKDNEIIVCITEEMLGEAFVKLLTEKRVWVAWVHTSVENKEIFFVHCKGDNFIIYKEEIIEYLYQKEYIFNGFFYTKDTRMDELLRSQNILQFEGNRELFEKFIILYLKNIGQMLNKVAFLTGYEKINSTFQKLGLRLARLYFEELVDSRNYIIDKEREKVLFYIYTAYPYLTDSIEPLINKYLEYGEYCILGFTDMYRWEPEHLLQSGIGLENYAQTFWIIDRMKKKGVICVWADRNIMSNYQYEICYSGHGFKIPPSIRENSKKVVALQTIAYYTHVYHRGREEYLKYFGEYMYNQVDYLITSEFIKEWIRDLNWKYGEVDWNNKVLALGYPKLDSLYHKLNGTLQTIKKPEVLKNKKKIILVVTFNDTPVPIDMYLPYFDKYDDIGFIWRPHPLWLDQSNSREKVKLLMENHKNIWIDDNISYMNSFILSDALIVELGNSLILNYLYTQKPVLITDIDSLPMVIPTYKEEAWYKSGYVANNVEQMDEFIQMILNGEDIKAEEQKPYREMMTKHFDGEVAERIYQYFK